MVFVGERCFKFYRIMLKAMGLWPYAKPLVWRIQTVFFFSVHCSSLMFQLTVFLTPSKCDIDCILKRFTYICITIICILNYYCIYFNSEIVKQMLKHLQLDWKMFENSDAIKIFDEYLYEAYIFALSIHILLFITGFIFVALEFRPIILDTIVPMNVSRPRKVEIDLELFVDEEQYFFLYLIQEMLGVLIGFWSLITILMFLATIGRHFCATYKIASNIIQYTVTVHVLQLPISQRMQFMHHNIRLAVHIHRRTMQFCEGLMISFNWWYFALLLIGVLSLSCIFFRLHNAIMQFNDFYDILIPMAILYGYLIYMFVANLMVHSYSEHSGKILEATYNTLWYVAPLPIQKLFLMLQVSAKIHKLVMGGLFVPSIEGFSTLLTSAVSYFTFMHSMQSSSWITN